MADLIDVSAIINDEGQLCAAPLLAAFEAVNELCTRLDTFIAQANPEGALLANGTVSATNCLSYANDGQSCGGPNDIPSFSQVQALFNDLYVCEKITRTTNSQGMIDIPNNGGKTMLQLVQPVPTSVIGIALSDGQGLAQVLGPMGPVPGVEVCVQVFEYLG